MDKLAYLYNCFVSFNGQKTDIALDDLLDKIVTLRPEDKLKRIKKDDYTSLSMVPENSSRIRKIGFGKYRNKKPYETDKGTDIVELIKRDVLEMSSAVFIPNSRLAIIEYNHYGPKMSAISDYLTSFLYKDDDNVWEVEFVPVESKLGWEDISASTDIKNLEIKLDIGGKSRHFISRVNNPESLFFKLIKNTVTTHNEFGANKATLTFSKGRKGTGFNKENLMSLLELLELESELFETVKIKYLSPKTRRTETIDLKNEGVKGLYLKNVTINNNWEFICNEILEEYPNNENSTFTKYGPLLPKRISDVIK
ncbi:MULTISPECIES: DUF6731 family protein [Bacillus]|uniref:DUF6731 family protein n=1 Tax=Bacillus TaxID=1386 RepID=UPI0009332E91|nr:MULTISPECIES: DUF6731 family protein [Bacillus]MDE0640022.1 hypothetical protein [Bacillus altitudinis]MDN4635789.1 hypothetical protein [Bacillus sp. PsM16]MEE3604325.1 DUF6731 family protein [Bacillus altitudinis]MEE3610147.1 DUF6731 family protein [Bacillus altitudinis]MEE3646064.1 DUF6731 family protein [Bacillus altitudinis]